MQQSEHAPKYLQVAIDIAKRIVSGDLRIGQALSGRSLLASQYKASPETIRRALVLLSETGVVEVRPQSGTIVRSRESAKQYVDCFQRESGSQEKIEEIRELLNELEETSRRLFRTVDNLVDQRISFTAVNSPFPNYEITISEDSELIGRTIGESRFWQITGCTIVGLKRGEEVIMSPGPDVAFLPNDTAVVVGTPECVELAMHFVHDRPKRDAGAAEKNIPITH